MGQNIISTAWARGWWQARNHLVCKLMDEDKSLTGREALKKANAIMKARGRHKPLAQDRCQGIGHCEPPKEKPYRRNRKICKGCRNPAPRNHDLCRRCRKEDKK
jgi:hypothetical protein